jgi:hypothetical protein
MFGKFSAARIVSSNKIHTKVRRMPYLFQSINCTEDIFVMLPPTVRQYQHQLGKNMRRNIKRYGATLQQDFPSCHYQIYFEQQVSEADIRAIIKLNRSHMTGKKIVSRIDENETQWIVRLVRQCDIVGVATIDGQACGGTIDFRICDNYFMHVIAHLAAKLMRVLRTLKHSNMGGLLSNHSAEKTG